MLKPRYGTRFHVTPKRWWRPSHRKAAKTAAAILDTQTFAPGELIYCDPRVIPRWPSSYRPRREITTASSPPVDLDAAIRKMLE